ncbi:hypothetical protein FGB62_27g16 [Gracilaria domingensis]|nr:hypothetical protein FGB62_27g16 [Gracilaria domingensis]
MKLLFTAIALFLLYNRAGACSCAPRTFEQIFADTDWVIKGTVLSAIGTNFKATSSGTVSAPLSRQQSSQALGPATPSSQAEFGIGAGFISLPREEYDIRVDQVFKGCDVPGTIKAFTLVSSSCALPLSVDVSYLLTLSSGSRMGSGVFQCAYNRPFGTLSYGSRRFLDNADNCCGDGCAMTATGKDPRDIILTPQIFERA